MGGEEGFEDNRGVRMVILLGMAHSPGLVVPAIGCRQLPDCCGSPIQDRRDSCERRVIKYMGSGE